ncbi:unnamed protein product, partial [Adineta steineri]
NKSLVQGRHVLDIGCGCGASAIASKMAGAINVIANDIDPDALIATDHNARLNNVLINKFSSDNLLQNPSMTLNNNVLDLLIIGDMCYDDQLAQQIVNLIITARQYYLHVLLADPGRHSFKSIVVNQLKDLMKCVCEYPIIDSDYIESDFNTIKIWTT